MKYVKLTAADGSGSLYISEYEIKAVVPFAKGSWIDACGMRYAVAESPEQVAEIIEAYPQPKE